MSRRPRYTDEQILETARELKAAKKDYDTWAVRKALGNVGRPDRIERILSDNEVLVIEAEKEEQQLYTLPPRFLEQVKAMQEALMNTASEMYTEASLVADNRVKEEFENARKSRIKAEKEVAEAKDAINHMEQEADAADQELEQLAKQMQILTQKVKDLTQEGDDLKKTQKIKEAKIAELKRDKADLVTSYDNAKTDIGRLQGEVSAQQDAVASAALQREAMQKQINTLMSERDIAKTQAEEKAGQVNDTKQQYEAAEERNTQLEKDKGHLQKEQQALLATHHQVSLDLSDQKQATADALKDKELLENKTESLIKERDQCRKRIENLENKLTGLLRDDDKPKQSVRGKNKNSTDV